MNTSNDSAATELYLVRIWKRKSVDGTLDLHGKLQHVVSGEACYFDGLPNLSGTLEKMIEKEIQSIGPDVGIPPLDGHQHIGGQHRAKK